MPNTPDQELDPVAKAGHSFGRTLVIDAQIGEQRPVIRVRLRDESRSLKNLKRAELEEKNRGAAVLFPDASVSRIADHLQGRATRGTIDVCRPTP
jgi:hypothetical protein